MPDESVFGQVVALGRMFADHELTPSRKGEEGHWPGTSVASSDFDLKSVDEYREGTDWSRFDF